MSARFAKTKDAEHWNELSDHPLTPVDHTTLLGQDVVVKPKALPQKQRERVLGAQDTARRIQRLRLRPDVVRSLVGAVVLPRLTYGIVPRPLPLKLVQNVRTLIKAALGNQHRQHSWEVLCLVANPGHRMDPDAYLKYTHLVNIVMGLKTREQAQTLWDYMWIHDAERSRTGPFRTTQNWLRQLGIRWEEPLLWHHDNQRIHLVKDPMDKIKHFLRVALRDDFRRKALKKLAASGRAGSKRLGS